MRTTEVVLKKRLVAPAQLQRALAEQRVTGASLEDALIALGFVSEDLLWRSLAEAAGLPFVEGEVLPGDSSSAALVPEAFAREHQVCPVSLDGGVLQVVQANPLDGFALEELRQSSGRDVETRCATRGAVARLIEMMYRPPEPAPVTPPDVRAPEPLQAATIRVAAGEGVPPAEEGAARGLDDLGLSRKSAAHVRELLARTQGLVVVTGPRGAGKKTTVQAALSFLRDRVRNIVTIEKPADEGDEAVGAREVGTAADRFAAAVRGLSPQDPDVIVTGDISAPETADLAVRAALSGVLVFGTLAVQDAAAVAGHLVEMGIAAPRVASALVGVVSQRLVRVVCADCRREATYAEGILAKAGLASAEGIKLYRGRGCEHCNGTGYRGRTGIFEVLRVDQEIQDLVRTRADTHAIREAAVRRGMRTQFDDVLAKALFGATTFEEVLKIAAGQARGAGR